MPTRPGTRLILAAAGCTPPTAIHGSLSPKSSSEPSTKHGRRGRAPLFLIGFPEDEQHEFRKAQEDFFKRVGERAQREPDVPAAALLAPDCRWNNLIGAIGTYISGAELDRVSARDFDNYDDTGVNWRVVEGYGATIAACGDGLPAILDCPVLRIDHQGKRLKIETPHGEP